MNSIGYGSKNQKSTEDPQLRKGETPRIREFLRTHDLTNPISSTILTRTNPYRYIAVISLLFGFGSLIFPFYSNTIRRVVTGIFSLAGGVSLFFYSSIQTRNSYLKDFDITIQFASWAVGGYILAISSFAYLLSGLSTFFYDFVIQNPDLIGFTLINGIFSLIISWATSNILGPISSFLLYLGLALLVFTGSIYLIIIFGGIPLLTLFINMLTLIAGILCLFGLFYLLTGWRKDALRFDQSLPIIRYGIVALKIMGAIWIIVSLMGDALFFSILLLGS